MSKASEYLNKINESIDIKNPGAFHRWLGVPEGTELSQDDIVKGLHSDNPHVRKMATFANNARKWKHK